LNIYSQNIYGNFSNGVGRKIINTNSQVCCFDFKIIWGINKEWNYLFERERITVLSVANSSCFGVNSEYLAIKFTIIGNLINILGGYNFIGYYYAKYLDLGKETYSVFKKPNFLI
jgi:hypothetical protein